MDMKARTGLGTALLFCKFSEKTCKICLNHPGFVLQYGRMRSTGIGDLLQDEKHGGKDRGKKYLTYH